MGLAVDVSEAIRSAERLLPGEPSQEGQDPRWQAIIAVGDFVESEPEEVWEFIRKWGSHPQEDLRLAIATCLLEHLLEYHFAVYFPLVEELALREPQFARTFLACWKFGMSKEPFNADRFEALHVRLRSNPESVPWLNDP